MGRTALSELTELSRYQRALEAIERRPRFEPRGGTTAALAFESGIENDYMVQRAIEALPLQRFALFLGLLFYVGFFTLDAQLAGRYTEAWARLLPLGLSAPMTLLLLWFTYIQRLRPHIFSLCAAIALVNAFALSFTSAMGVQHGVLIAPEPQVIQQLYNVFLLALPFRLAAPITVISVVIYVAVHQMVGMPAHLLFERGFMLAASALIGLIACFLMERTQRLSWLRAQLLRELSEHDPLTGIYNRRIFYTRGEQTLRQARRDSCGVAMLIIDVDHFKRYNDTHGHLAGDECLRQVAMAIQSCSRRPLDVAARLGGEEFGLMLYNITPESARVRAELLCNVIRGMDLPEERRVTVSVGIVSVTGEHITTVEALVGRADSHLYRAKTEGRDRVCD